MPFKQVTPLDIVNTSQQSLKALFNQLSLVLHRNPSPHTLELSKLVPILTSLNRQLKAFNIYPFSTPQHLLESSAISIKNQTDLKNEILNFTTLLIDELTLIQQKNDSPSTISRLSTLSNILFDYLHEKQFKKYRSQLFYSKKVNLNTITTLFHIEIFLKNFLSQVNHTTINFLDELEHIYTDELKFIHSFNKNYSENINNIAKKLFVHINQNRLEFHFKSYFLSFKDKQFTTYINKFPLKLPQRQSTYSIIKQTISPITEEENNIITFYSTIPQRTTYRALSDNIILTHADSQQQITHASDHIFSLLEKLFLERYPKYNSIDLSHTTIVKESLINIITASLDLCDLSTLPDYNLLKQSLTQKDLSFFTLTPNSLRYKKHLSNLLQKINNLLCKITPERKNELIESMHKRARDSLLNIEFNTLGTELLSLFIKNITLFLTKTGIQELQAYKLAYHIVIQIKTYATSKSPTLNKSKELYNDCIHMTNNSLVMYQRYMLAHAIHYAFIHYVMLGKIMKISAKHHNYFKLLLTTNAPAVEEAKKIKKLRLYLINNKLITPILPFNKLTHDPKLASRIDSCTQQLALIHQVLHNHKETDFRNTLSLFNFFTHHPQQISQSEINNLIKISKHSISETSKIYNKFLTFNKTFDIISLDPSLKRNLYKTFQKTKKIKKDLKHLSLLKK